MAEMKEKVRHMPRRAKVISALLACVLVITLIGVAVVAAAPIDIVPDDPKTVKINGFDLELSRPTSRGSELDTDGYPAYKTLDGEPYEFWTYAPGKLTGEVQTCLTDNESIFDTNTGVLKIKNIGNQKIFLKFHYEAKSTYTTYILNIGGKTVKYSSGDYNTSEVIAPGDSVEIWLTAKGTQKFGLGDELPTAKISITDIKVEAVAGQTIELLTPENGTYTATKKGQDGADISTVNNAGVDTKSIAFDPAENETVTFTATHGDGYKFYMWVDRDGTPLSTKPEITVDGSQIATTSIRPVFVSDQMAKTPTYRIQGDSKLSGDYYYWDDAMNAALNGPEKNVVLLQSLSLSAAQKPGSDATNTFEIPNGVTLVVPYSDKLSTGKEDAVNVGDGNYINPIAKDEYGFEKGYNGTGSAFRTLTVPENYTLNVNGTLLVNAVQGAINGADYQSHVLGNYGHMEVVGTVNVNAGGTLYARGYVTGAGDVNVLDNGTLYQMLQLVDWRGGNYSVPVASSNDYPTLPFSGYYLQNNMVHTTYNYGASMKARAVIAAMSDGKYLAVGADVPVIANGDASNPSLFVMAEGASIETEYDKAEDQLKVTLNGNTSMNCLQLNVGVYSLTTEGKELAISDNIQVTVASGKMTIAGGLKFLPGAKLTVAEKATLEIANKGKAFFYARNDYKDAYTYDAWRNKLQAAEVIGNTTKVTPTENADLDLHGSLVINGTLALSKSHPGLTANDGASVTVNNITKASKLKLYEPYKDLNYDSYEESGYPLPNIKDNDVSPILVYEEEVDDGYYKGAYVFENRGWSLPKGLMADGSSAPEAFAKGVTYRVHDGKWYSHEIQLTYTCADGVTPAAKTVYSAKDIYQLDAPENYVITGIQVGDSGVVYANADKNDSNSIADGWTSAKLGSLPAKAALTIAVKPYAQKLTWKSMVGDKVTMTNYSYLPAGATQASLTYDDVLTVGGISMTDANGASVACTSQTADENGKTTVTVKGSEGTTLNGATVTVAYTGAKAVTWNVTDINGNVTTKIEELGDKSELTYTIKQPNGGWYIADTVESKDTSIQLVNNDVSVTVSNISGPVTVNIKLKAAAHKLTTTINTVDSDGANKTETKVTYTSDDTWNYETAERHIIAQYAVTGGKMVVSGQEYAPSMDTGAITEALAVSMSERETTVALTDYAYHFCLTWNAVDVTQESKPTVDAVSYREYVTGKCTTETNEYGDEHKAYTTFCTNGTEGKYYWDTLFEEGSITYTIPDKTRFAYIGDDNYQATVKNYPESIYDAIDKTKDKIIELEVAPYLYNVEVYNAADPAERLKILCIDKNGNDVTTNETPVYKDWDDDNSNSPTNKKFISGYEVVGNAVINGSKGKEVSGITAYGNERYQGPGLSITKVNADTKITATFQHYELCYFWNIAGLQEEPVHYLEFVTENTNSAQQGVVDKSSGGESHTWSKGEWGYSAKYTAPLGYYIQSIDNNINYNDRISADKRTGETNSYSGGKGENTFYLAPYTAYVACTVDGTAAPEQSMLYVAADSAYNVNAENYNAAASTWTYTLPEGKYIAANGVKATGCIVMETSADRRSVKIGRIGKDSKLQINTVTPATDYYMGNMSFEYVRNAAAFTWDGAVGTTGTWKPLDSFTWRHTAGSKSFKVANTNLAYTVANGSILLVNGDNTEKTFTISITGMVTGGSVKMYVGDQQVTESGINITVPAGQTQTVAIALRGAPNAYDKAADGIGTITVKKN